MGHSRVVCEQFVLFTLLSKLRYTNGSMGLKLPCRKEPIVTNNVAIRRSNVSFFFGQIEQNSYPLLDMAAQIPRHCTSTQSAALSVSGVIDTLFFFFFLGGPDR